MTDSIDSNLRWIMIDPQNGPVSAVREEDARRAAVAYPNLACHAPSYGAVEHVAGGRWRIIVAPSDGCPQMVRDDLTAYFRRLAVETDDDGLRREYEAAYTTLEWEKHDELIAGDRRVRVFRVERFVRTGSSGPEPPRASDPDPVGREVGPDPRLEGLVIDPEVATGWADAGLKLQVLASNYPRSMPEQVGADSRRALATHPGGMLLPVVFTEGEKVNGRWQATGGTWSSPRRTREGIAFGLRLRAERGRRLGEPDPGEELRRRWLEAADLLEKTRCHEVSLPGRIIRVVRVEQLVRIGPDGPEPPRPSDPDPESPIEVQTQQNQNRDPGCG